MNFVKMIAKECECDLNTQFWSQHGYYAFAQIFTVNGAG